MSAVKSTATGQGVIKRPVSTADRPSTSSRKNGSETKRRIGVIHLPARSLVVFGRVKQVLMQGLAIDRESLRP